MGILSCVVISRGSHNGSKSVLHPNDSFDKSDEGVVRYDGQETPYDTLPSLHSLRNETQRKFFSIIMLFIYLLIY